MVKYGNTLESSRKDGRLANTDNIYDKRTGEMQDAINQKIVNVSPADEEDLTNTIDEERRSVTKFADRSYSPSTFSGKGYKILRKNIQKVSLAVTNIIVSTPPSSDGYVSFIINGIETHVDLLASTDNTTSLVAEKIAAKLAETMTEYDVSHNTSSVTLVRKFGGTISSPSSFSGNSTGALCAVSNTTKTELRNIITSAMVNASNTTYEIRYDFDLNGEIIEIPDGCELKFEGGCFSNGTIRGFNTEIKNNKTTIFRDVQLIGNFLIEGVCPEWFGKLGVNDSLLLEKAIYIAGMINSGVIVNSVYNISLPIKIYREVDGEYNKYIHLKGNGEIKISEDITAFTSGYNTNLPSSQYLEFNGITFSGDKGSYVIDNSIIRLSFINCSFFVNFINSNRYVQSIYFSNCLIRDLSGTWFRADNGCYDVKFSQCAFENGDNTSVAIKLSSSSEHKISNVSVFQCLFENLKCAIKYGSTHNLSIIGCYFEENIEGSIIALPDSMNIGISILNNYFYNKSKEDNTSGNGFYHIIWNKTYASVAMSNFSSSGNLHYTMSSVANIFLKDTREISNTNICNNTSLLHNIWYGDVLPSINGAIVKYSSDVQIGDIIINTDFNNRHIGWICNQGGRYDKAKWIKIGCIPGTLDGSEDLNEYMQNGLFFPEKVNAREWNATGDNYPTRQAGILEVNSNNDCTFVKQTYTVAAEQNIPILIYSRTYYAYGGRWSEWTRVGEGVGAELPTLNNYYQGYTYYSITLKKKILWNGSSWVNMDGTALS